MKKYIVGLGCSWTQGEGGYPDDIWKAYKGRVQIRQGPDNHLRKYEHENSWVNVLCRDHFPEYTPINAGARGIGNRAAVNQLHFIDKIDWNNSTGIIVLLWSGFERLDFANIDPSRNSNDPPLHDDGYNNGQFRHYKWRTAWPIEGMGGAEEPVWRTYARFLHSEKFVATEQMMSLLNLQAFAKAHNFKVVLANAYNHRDEGLLPYLENHVHSDLFNKFDWSAYLNKTTDYTAFVQKLVEMDNIMGTQHWLGFHEFYRKLDWPQKYLTNCEGAHPTIEGYKVIASEMAKFIKYKGYA